eukprot:tig00000042_g15682.t1
MPGPAAVSGDVHARFAQHATRIPDHRMLASKAGREGITIHTGAEDPACVAARQSFYNWMMPSMRKFAEALPVRDAEEPWEVRGLAVQATQEERGMIVAALGAIATRGRADAASRWFRSARPAPSGPASVAAATLTVEVWTNSLEYTVRLPCPACGAAGRAGKLIVDSVRERSVLLPCYHCRQGAGIDSSDLKSALFEFHPPYVHLEALRLVEGDMDRRLCGDPAAAGAPRVTTARLGATARRRFAKAGRGSDLLQDAAKAAIPVAIDIASGASKSLLPKEIAQEYAALDKEQKKTVSGPLAVARQLPPPDEIDAFLADALASPDDLVDVVDGVIRDENDGSLYVDYDLIWNEVQARREAGARRIIVALPLGMGRGKTEASTFVWKLLQENPEIVGRSGRDGNNVKLLVFLNSRAQQDELVNETRYKDVLSGREEAAWIPYSSASHGPWPERGAFPENLATTLESARHFVDHSGVNRHDSAFLDEVGKLLAILANGATLSKDDRRQQAVAAIAIKLGESYVTLIADADLSVPTLTFFLKLLDAGLEGPEGVTSTIQDEPMGAAEDDAIEADGERAELERLARRRKQHDTSVLLYQKRDGGNLRHTWTAAEVADAPLLVAAHIRIKIVVGGCEDSERFVFRSAEAFADADIILYNSTVAQGTSVNDPRVRFDRCIAVHAAPSAT